MPLQTRLTDLLMGCYMQIALELKGRFNYTTRSAKQKISSTPLHPTPCTTLAALHSQVTTYRAPSPSIPLSLVHLLPLPPAALEFVFRTWLPPSRVPESRRGERGRGNQSGIIGDAALSTANERPVNHRSVQASEQAQAEVNPLSSSSITVATCECLLLLLRSLRPLRPLALPAVPLIPVRPLVAWLPEIAVSDARSRNSVRALGLRLSTLVDVFRVQCGYSLSKRSSTASKLKYAPQRGNSVIG